MSTAPSVARFNRNNPCPVCGGFDQAPRHKGTRCFGFLSSDRQYAHCTRPEYAGSLEPERDSQSYAHRLEGPCRCGQTHRPAPPSTKQSAISRGRIIETHDYPAADGSPNIRVLRWEPKHFTQESWSGSAWVPGLNGAPRVLYRLPELLAADPKRWVLMPEGERCANLLAAKGLIATTTSGGAGQTHLTDLEPLRGRRVALLPDNDEPGHRRGQQDPELLTGIAAEIRVVKLPGLPEHGDVVQFFEAGGTVGDLHRLIEATPAWKAGDGQEAAEGGGQLAAVPEPPLDALSGAFQGLVTDAQRAGLPAALVAGAGLAAVTTAIGDQAEVEVSSTWRERAILWVPLIAPRGAGKSPSQALAFGPIRQHDAVAWAGYQQNLRDWKAQKFPERGARPPDPTLLAGDTTLEALVRRFENRAAIGLDVDELQQLLRGLGEYKVRGGGDRGRFLTLWSGAPWRYGRVTGETEILISRPTLVICGGLQPPLHGLLGGEEDGLRPRWLPVLAATPEGVEPPAGEEALSQSPPAWQALLVRLIGQRGEARRWTLTPAARERFLAYRRGWKGQARTTETAGVSAALIKADVQLLRVTLALAEMDAPGEGGEVSTDLVDRAAAWVDFSLDCWRALPEADSLALSRKDEVLDRAVDRLRDWVEQHGGQAKKRDLLRSNVGGVRTAADLDAVLGRYEATYPGCIGQERGARGFPGIVVAAPKRLSKKVSAADTNKGAHSVHSAAHPEFEQPQRSAAKPADTSPADTLATGKDEGRI